MLIDLAKTAKIHKFGLANSLLGSPMATWLTLMGTLDVIKFYFTCLGAVRECWSPMGKNSDPSLPSSQGSLTCY